MPRYNPHAVISQALSPIWGIFERLRRTYEFTTSEFWLAWRITNSFLMTPANPQCSSPSNPMRTTRTPMRWCACRRLAPHGPAPSAARRRSRPAVAAFLLAIGACLTEPPEDTAARLRQTQGIEAAIAFLESQTGLDEETRHRVEAALRELRLTAVRETWAQLAAADPEVSRLDPATFEAMLLRLQSCGPFGPDEKRLYGDIVQVLAGVYQARGECERAYRILAGGYDFTADTGLISEAARTLSRCKDAAYVDRQFTALLERFKENLAVRELYADVLVKRQELPRAIALFEVLRQHPDASPTDRLRYTALLSTLRQWGATGAVQAQPPASPTSVTAPPKP